MMPTIYEESWSSTDADYWEEHKGLVSEGKQKPTHKELVHLLLGRIPQVWQYA